jgi:hypothetical protein
MGSQFRRYLLVQSFSASVLVLATLIGWTPSWGQETESNGTLVSKNKNANRIEDLAQFLTGSRWDGHFTTIRQNGEDGAARKESYEISKAEKLPEGDLWMLTARIKYGKRDVTVPLPINIIWAGDTPVITVDQLLVPGMGTFDARVLIRDKKYSGTWTHNDHGGHLFGTIGRVTPVSQ